MVNNKLAFPLLMKHHGIPTPEVRGVIRKGLFYPLHPGRTMAPSKFIEESCKPEEQLVLKPIWGAHGIGVIMVKRSVNGFKLNGKDTPLHTFNDILNKLENYVVTDFVSQGEYGARLYSDTTNTIRMVTFWDAETKKPFIAKVVQRIGTSRSYPVDNFRAGRGGLSASIDPDTGELGSGAMVDTKGHVTWHSHHPESHAQIQGTIVPSWDKIRTSILEYSDRFAFAPCIGWDIVPTHSGFSIIEGNSTPGMPVLQVHGPILTDPRIRRFYKYHHVIT
ncbi:sugar-transfer associated ATP-grasp domain-containing protein [Thermodesulfobacteriota bacterium]